jgi:hypothetical protein
LPVVSLSDIPFIGSTIRGLLLSVVEYWNAAQDTFPYLIVLWHVFIYVILPFELLMLTVKLVLGSRAPK